MAGDKYRCTFGRLSILRPNAQTAQKVSEAMWAPPTDATAASEGTPTGDTRAVPTIMSGGKWITDDMMVLQKTIVNKQITTRARAKRRKHSRSEHTTQHERDGRRTTDDGRGTTSDGRRATDDGRRTTNDGRRTTDDGQQTTDDGRRTTDDGRRTTGWCHNMMA